MQRGSSDGTVTARSLSARSRMEKTEAMEFFVFPHNKENPKAHEFVAEIPPKRKISSTSWHNLHGVKCCSKPGK